MAGHKRNAADRAVEFFHTADLEAARAVLAVCQGTVTRRSKATPATAAHALEEARRKPARRSRDVTAGEVATPEGGSPGAGIDTRAT